MSKVTVRRSEHQQEHKRTINIYVGGRKRVEVFWINGSPYMGYKVFNKADHPYQSNMASRDPCCAICGKESHNHDE